MQFWGRNKYMNTLIKDSKNYMNAIKKDSQEEKKEICTASRT